MWHGWGREDVYEEILCERLWERNRLEDLDVDGRIILKWVFKKYDGPLTGFFWIRRETSGGLF